MHNLYSQHKQESNMSTTNTSFYPSNNTNAKAKANKILNDALIEKKQEFDLLTKRIKESHFFTKETKKKLLSDSVQKALKQEFVKDAEAEASTYLNDCCAFFEQWGIKPYNTIKSKVKIEINTNSGKQYLIPDQSELNKIVLIPRKAFFVLFPDIAWNTKHFLDANLVTLLCSIDRISNQTLDNIYLSNIIKLALEKSTNVKYSTNKYFTCFVAEKLEGK